MGSQMSGGRTHISRRRRRRRYSSGLVPWRPRRRQRPPQAGYQAEHSGEDVARQRRLGKLAHAEAGITHHPLTGVDQPLAKRAQRPCLETLGRRQRTQQVCQVGGQRVELEPDGVCRVLHAGEPRPLERVIALLEVLLDRASMVLERQHSFARQAAVRDDGPWPISRPRAPEPAF